MITLYFITGYIASVFICRWANKIVYGIDIDILLVWIVWLIPFINIAITFVLLVYFIYKKINDNNNYYFKWFKGDYWKYENK